MPENKRSPEKLINISKSPGDSLQPDYGTRDKYILKLYISGMTLRSRLAIENIRKINADYLPHRCNLEIVDIFKHPDRAKEAQIIAVPTLVKHSPLPMHRMIGDLSQTERVLSALDLASFTGNKRQLK